jgi:hypothetical protein
VVGHEKFHVTQLSYHHVLWQLVGRACLGVLADTDTVEHQSQDKFEKCQNCTIVKRQKCCY